MRKMFEFSNVQAINSRILKSRKFCMISELTVSHYRSVGEVTLNFESVNVLVGRNGSGKSNIVDAISFLSDVANEDLDYAIVKRHGVESIRQWSKYKPYHVSISAKILNKFGEGFYKLVFSSSRGSYKIVEEVLEWSGETLYDDEKYKSILKRNQAGEVSLETDYDQDDIDHNEISNVKYESNSAVISRFYNKNYSLNWLFGYVKADLRSFTAYSISPNTIRSPQSVSRAVNLESDGKNIASVIKSLNSENRRRIVKHLQVVMPNLLSISVKSAAGYYVPVFQVAEPGEGAGHELNMSQVSDGTLRILGMLTAFYQSNAPKIIVIEEPEQMIHPALLIVFRDAVVDFIHRREESQVFVTTHSSVLMDLFDVNSIIAVQYDGSSSRAGRVSERQRKFIQSGLMTLGDVVLAEGIEID